MQNVNRKKIEKDYRKLKIKARNALENGKLEHSIFYLTKSAKLANSFNLVYTDDELEDLIAEIGNKTNKEGLFEPDSNRIVFYDYYAWDNRGLTQQYLRGLKENKYEILFISHKLVEDKSSEIIKELKNYRYCQIFEIDNKLPNVEKSIKISQIISDFKPDSILIHTSPWDVAGLLGLYNIRCSNRYLINLTDHAFWLGKKCLDFVIEFRSYGCNISKKLRKIDHSKLVYLPYYPIIDDKYEFEGLPFELKSKKIIFSGATSYKIYDKENTFFDILRYIVTEYDDTIVVFAGGGDMTAFRKFIQEEGFEERIFLIGHRKDIVELFRRCHFYLNSFPFGGGLMTMYSIALGKIPVGYNIQNLPFNNIESLLYKKPDFKMTFYEKEELNLVIEQLLTNKEYVKEKESQLQNLLIGEEKFAEQLNNLLKRRNNLYEFKDVNVYPDFFSNLYIDLENIFFHNYSNLIDSSFLAKIKKITVNKIKELLIYIYRN